MLASEEVSGDEPFTGDQPLLDLDRLLKDEESNEAEFPDLGPGFVALRLLGAGSAGEVYAARQLGPVERDVAVKVYRPFRMDALRRRRFETEARALAALSHPGIAQIRGTGETPDGQPFLVMELVPGTAITKACRDAELDCLARIELLASLCRIVHHAHQRGIIHRDLKPRNILAHMEGGAPVVKVIDFGLAKLMDESAAGHHERTMTGQLLGTIAFMSPEQLRGESADARSDIYAIGLVILEVLSGQSMEPRVGALDADPDAARRHLDTLLRDLPSRVRRDLVTIAACATADRAADRYPSAAHLADEIERVLRGDSILTRRTPMHERVIRFARRSPGTATVTCLLVISCLSLVAALAASRADLEHEAHAQRETIRGMLDDVLDQLEDRSGSAAARRALVPPLLARSRELRRRYPADIELLEAASRLTMLAGEVAFEAGAWPEATGFFEEAAELFAELADRAQADLAVRRSAVTAIIRIGDMLGRDDPDAALVRYEQALAMHEALHEAHPDHLSVLDDLSWSFHRIALLHMDEKRFDQAAPIIEQRMAVARRLVELDPDRLASTYTLMSGHFAASTLASHLQQHERARHEAKQAVVLGRAILARDPHRLSVSLTQMLALVRVAASAEAVGDHAEATEALDDLLDLMEAMRLENPDNDFALRNVLVSAIASSLVALDINDPHRTERIFAIIDAILLTHPDLLHDRERLATARGRFREMTAEP